MTVYWNDGVHQTDFLGSLAYTSDQVAASSLFYGPFNNISGDFDNYLSSANLDAQRYFSAFLLRARQSGHFLSSWADLVSRWNTYQTTAIVPAAPPGSQVLSQNLSNLNNINLFNGFVSGYLDATGTASNFTGDWSILNTPPSVISSQSFTDQTNASVNPFVQAFNKFLSTYDPNTMLPDNNNLNVIDGNGLAGSTQAMQKFLGSWQNFMDTTALIQSPSQSTNPTLFAHVSTYEAIYTAFGPKGATLADFTNRIKQFYTSEMGTYGYFLPSQSLSRWISTLRAENHLTGVASSSLTGNDSQNILIINRILQLLIRIIQSLQNVGIAQANKLTFYTRFQQAYTSLQTQIPVFLAGQAGAIGGSDQAAKDARGELNSSFNALLADNLRNLRGLQEDNAKKAQADVNQTNDAVNQQSDMVTTFIQQMSSLTSTILH